MRSMSTPSPEWHGDGYYEYNRVFSFRSIPVCSFCSTQHVSPVAARFTSFSWDSYIPSLNREIERAESRSYRFCFGTSFRHTSAFGISGVASVSRSHLTRLRACLSYPRNRGIVDSTKGGGGLTIANLANGLSVSWPFDWLS